jgi:hypothetical protein
MLVLAGLPAWLMAYSSHEQDKVVSGLFDSLGWPTNGSCVEFGYKGEGDSNSQLFRERHQWSCLLMDGSDRSIKMSPTHLQVKKEFITSENIAQLFHKYRVPTTVDYVSIDIDSTDIWILRTLLESEFRPRVVTIEYNSNYPAGRPICFPNPAWEQLNNETAFWDSRGHYSGSSASAIEAAARERGYSVVDVVPGLDLFLVRDDLVNMLRKRQSLSHLRQKYFMTFNIRHFRTRHSPMSEARQKALLDYEAFSSCDGKGDAAKGAREAGGGHTACLQVARQAAAKHIEAMREAGSPLFTPVPDCKLVDCPGQNSHLCTLNKLQNGARSLGRDDLCAPEQE